MRILGYHISNGIIANSDGEHTIEPPFLDFLLQPKTDTIKVFYHLGYNVANLIKLINLTKEEAKRLHDTSKLRLPPYELTYPAGKSRFFSAKKGYYFGNPFATFSDMSQYSPAELNEAETVESCTAKAKLAKITGEIVYGALAKLGCHPTSLTSPIKVFEKEYLKKLALATVDDIPEEAGYYAYQCCDGNWLEAFQLGHWEQAWDYDINSAYPSEVAQLLDLKRGKWIESKEFIPEAAYGYCLGVVTIHAPFSPIFYHKEGKGFESTNYAVVGSWERCLTKKQIEFIEKWKLGGFEIKNGWWWNADERVKPLENTVKQLQTQKELSTGLEREVIKRTMAGIFGKFLQKIGGGLGEMFNPVYGAEVEVNTQLKVAEFALQNNVVPLQIAVDGMLLDKPAPTKVNPEMGDWKQAATAPCIIAGTGAVAVKGREQTGEFSLSYDWLKRCVEQEPAATVYKMSKWSPVTLAVALSMDKWDKLGSLQETTKTVDIGGEIKRCYRVAPKNGGELLDRHYESEPWDVSLVSKLT